MERKVKRNIGPQGRADVKQLKNDVRVIFHEGQKAEGEYRFDYDQVPDVVRDGAMYVRINKDADRLLGMKPIDKGTYFVEFAGFVSKRDSLPAPVMTEERTWQNKQTGASGTIPSHLEFRAILRFIGKPYEGLEVTYPMWYLFKESESNPGTAMLHGTAGRIDQILEFLELNGFDPDVENIPYSENVLPKLEELLQRRVKEDNIFFQVTLKDGGWVDSISAPPVGIDRPAPMDE